MARPKGQPSFPTPAPKTLSGSNTKSFKSKVLGSTKSAMKSPNPFSFDSPLFQRPASHSKPRSVKFSRLRPAERAFRSGWRQIPRERERPLIPTTDASSSSEKEDEDETTLAEIDFWTGNFTLNDELEEDEAGEDDAARTEALVLSLQAPFAALSTEMKTDLMDVVGPTTGMLKDVHARIKELDGDSRLAVMHFSRSAETIQVGAAEQAAKLRSLATESQIKVHQTFQAIKDAYSARNAARTSLISTLRSIQSQLENDLDVLDTEYEQEAKALVRKSEAIAKSKTTRADMDKYLKMMMSAME